MTGAEQAGSDDHTPLTPDWTCGTCGADWPCAPKRARLLQEYRVDRPMLSVYLGACLAAATEDLRSSPDVSLQERFMGWLPRPRRRY